MNLQSDSKKHRPPGTSAKAVVSDTVCASVLRSFIGLAVCLAFGLAGVQPALAAESFCFVVTGDSRGDKTFPDGRQQINTAVFTKVMREAAVKVTEDAALHTCGSETDRDFAVILGDLIDGDLNQTDTESQFTAWKEAFSTEFSTSQLLTAFGANHDGNKMSDNPWDAWDSSFDPVNTFSPGNCVYPGAEFGDYGHTVYYCEVENALFFVLNNEMALGGDDDGRISQAQLDWVATVLAANDAEVSFFLHQVPTYGVFKKGMIGADPTMTGAYLGLVAGAMRPMIFAADEHNYHRRRIDSELNAAVSAGSEFYELKLGPAGAPVRNRACAVLMTAVPGQCTEGMKHRQNVEFFRAPERFTENARKPELYLLGLEHYFGIVSVDNSGNTPSVSVRVYAVSFPTVAHNALYVEDLGAGWEAGVTTTLIDHVRVYDGNNRLPSPAVELIEPFMGSEGRWKYVTRSTAPAPDGSSNAWYAPEFDDSAWLDNGCIGVRTDPATPGSEWRTGLGQKDDDDCRQVAVNSGIFTRMSFDIADPALVQQLVLSMDFDDGFRAYINGVEVACANVPGSTRCVNALDMGIKAHEARGCREGRGKDDPALGCRRPHPDFQAKGFSRQVPIDYAVDLNSVQLVAGAGNVLAIEGWNRSDSDFSLIPSLRSVAAPIDLDLRWNGAGTKVILDWSNATGARVDVYRNGVPILNTPNDGRVRVPDTSTEGGALYKVCEEGGMLVCSPAKPTPPLNGEPPAIDLDLRWNGAGTKVILDWSNATGARVDVYRNGVPILNTPNDGRVRVPDTSTEGGALYKVCEEGGMLVCSPAVPTPPLNGEPPTIDLTLRWNAAGTKVILDWSNATGARVDVYRNGVPILNTANDGQVRDTSPEDGAVYKVCEEGGMLVCSPDVTAPPRP